jgi:tetratricopeptide (TPR) repeat protein
LNIETELESFDATLAFLSDHASDPAALKNKTLEIVSAIEWGLFDGPELVDRAYLPPVFAGVRKLVGTLGRTAALAGEDSDQTYAYALYKICDWRAQSTDIVRSWLGGWWTQNGGDASFGTTILAGLSDGLRLLQFAFWWLWRFYVSPRAWRLKRRCRTVNIVAPPPQAEASTPPSSPAPPPRDEQLQCIHLDELAALLGVKFGSACAEEVVRAYRTRLEYADWDVDTRWDLARCYAGQGDYARAVQAYAGVLQAQPEFHDARKELIFCLAALGQWSQAESEARYLKGFKNAREEARLALQCLQTLRHQGQE